MLVYETKVAQYLKTNKVVHNFIQEVDQKISEHYTENLPNLSLPFIKVDLGNKFIRIWFNNNCWGFISRIEGMYKGAPIRKGDLLRPAAGHSPAKHARGNIADGTAQWGIYGPVYYNHIIK